VLQQAEALDGVIPCPTFSRYIGIDYSGAETLSAT
jgi:hypothetical protein